MDKAKLDHQIRAYKLCAEQLRNGADNVDGLVKELESWRDTGLSPEDAVHYGCEAAQDIRYAKRNFEAAKDPEEGLIS